MRRLGTTIAAAVALATAATLFVTPASATPSAGGPITLPSAPSDEGAITVADPNATDPLIAKWDPYVRLSGGQYVINAPESVVLADSDGYAQAARIVAKTNSTLTADGFGSPSISKPLLGGSSGSKIASAGSHGSATSYWWGWSIWLDHWATGRLTAVFNTAAAASGLTAAIMAWTGVGGGLAAVIAGVLWAGGAVFSLCDWNDRGINYKYVNGVGSVCWAR
ncbi:hypothetical protein [Cellulomonas soli]|uniref:Uncharacterized protein n=1 Tax=Cellulomonas soli TaxID=931535 RepID=A0A512PGS1_9CELL|nr:hypothetical protein [Cellulomonas soli]NYI59604.1 hypothetical protein [Cellulomonas soli]GEP70396.1 hypothetical protein CSO01_31110 [Cellulomonas soli]